jgi:hypothetical protein
MNKTPFSKRVEIMGYFYGDVFDLDSPSSFVKEHEEILTLCLYSNSKYIAILDRMKPSVDATWDAFCLALGVDKYGNYENYHEIMEIAGAEEWS